jgi:hypothetical protein
MSKRTFQRKFRSDLVSAEQAARDDRLRQQIQAEFPPLESKSGSPILSEPLRQAIAKSRKPVQKLAEEAEISPVMLEQFLSGKCDLRLATAEKLASLLGLKLVAS